MTAAQALLNLLAEIDRTCISAPSDTDKVLVALDVSLLDRAYQIAHKERQREREDDTQDHSQSNAP